MYLIITIKDKYFPISLISHYVGFMGTLSCNTKQKCLYLSLYATLSCIKSELLKDLRPFNVCMNELFIPVLSCECTDFC